MLANSFDSYWCFVNVVKIWPLVGHRVGHGLHHGLPHVLSTPPIYDQNGWKTTPFGAAHIREYPHPGPRNGIICCVANHLMVLTVFTGRTSYSWSGRQLLFVWSVIKSIIIYLSYYARGRYVLEKCQGLGEERGVYLKKCKMLYGFKKIRSH